MSYIWNESAEEVLRLLVRAADGKRDSQTSRKMPGRAPWLEAEIEAVKPKIIVALGATAAQSLMGSTFRLTRDRGKVFEQTPWNARFIATYHPSFLLRIPEENLRRRTESEFLSDLKLVRVAAGQN